MMFGNLRKKRGIGILPGDQPEVDMGDFGRMPQGDGMMQEPQKPSFFGRGGTGRNIAGHLGDFLLQNSGFDPIYGPNVQQQRAIEAQQQNELMKRRMANQDWYAKEQFKIDNRRPESTAFQRDYEWLKQTDPKAAEQYKRNKVTAPPMVVTNPDNTKTIYPAGTIPRGNLKPRGKLTPVGGAGSNASGGF